MFADLSELDAAIEAASRILQLSREGCFEDCVEAITADIKQIILPGCLLLLCAADGKTRKAIGARYRKLRDLISN
jgi:hypothetical protein